MNWCFIIPLIVGLICGVLGYLLGKQSAATATKVIKDVDNTEVLKWREKYADLEGQLVECRKSLKLEREKGAVGTVLPFDAAKVKAVFGKKVKQDDLKIVEGIGPKIEELFHNNGIKTWKDLSETTVLRCKKILKSGGKAFEIHRPDTWPKQAEMAYKGLWEELKQWQKTLDGGR
ncbi:hypothetical protein [Galbibacter sp.]|uniref:hypothetical protein n=1 Tax=Galbibacter sp. TaxID=2918471 RepID=UPI002CAD9344|nr:hypothetical protein [Galbibacter sp.]HLV63862.1 hypothetical protein [Galbibacter sp.]